MDTHGNVWCTATTVSPVDQAHEESSKQEFEKTTTDIPNLEGSRPRDTRQSDH